MTRYWVLLYILLASLMGCEDDIGSSKPLMSSDPSADQGVIPRCDEGLSDIMAGESAAGESAAGESAAGESAAGESAAGESAAGESAAGESAAGESAAGESAAGESMAGESMAGESMAGESAAGESAAGESAAGESMAGESAAGESAAGESAAGESMVSPQASARYDGQYFASFESEGVKTALARVLINRGLVEGEVQNRYGETITLGGFIDANGVLRIPPLSGSVGSTFNAVGRVSTLGIIEGTFSVSGVVERVGTFAGSLENRPIYQPSPEYDGLYELSFIRDDEEVAVTSMSIDHGRFSVNIVSVSGNRFSASGFVSEDGTMALLGAAPDELLAEGFIDPDTRKINGIYSIGRRESVLIGDISGKEAD